MRLFKIMTLKCPSLALHYSNSLCSDSRDVSSEFYTQKKVLTGTATILTSRELLQHYKNSGSTENVEHTSRMIQTSFWEAHLDIIG